MSIIRIAIAAALVLTVLFAGGTGHTSRGQAPATAHPHALAGGSLRNSPVLCC
jgi:hypothetical protein